MLGVAQLNFIIRNRKYESELRREMWKIKYDDILFTHGDIRKTATSYEFSESKVCKLYQKLIANIYYTQK